MASTPDQPTPPQQPIHTDPPIREVPAPDRPEPGLPDLTDVPPPAPTDGWPEESDPPHLDHGDV